MLDTMRILLACDRSKGHFYPALNLARVIKSEYPGFKIIFCGTKSEESSILRKEGFIRCGIDLMFRNIFLEAVLRFAEALLIIICLHPQRVIGFGGRNSFFIVILSKLFFVPVFLVEPNASYGMANKVLYYFSDKVFLGIKSPQTRKEIKTGVPLRDQVIKVKKDKSACKKELGLTPDKKTILVFGGSLGAKFINNLVLEAVEAFSTSLRNLQIIHITGKHDFKRAVWRYENISVESKVFAFYEDMGDLYLASDLVICRSGASTAAEICYFSKPVIFIPYPYAYGHQVKNAEFLERRYGAIMYRQESIDKTKLRLMIEKFLNEADIFSILADNLKKCSIWTTQLEFSKKVSVYL